MAKQVKVPPKTDVTEELIASMEEAVRIVAGEVAPSRVHHPVAVPDVDVRAARQLLGMTQPVFAARFGVALPTLRKWEQGKRRPDGPARVLLRVIEREPDAVRRALLVEAE
jgi:putative transcriptional regulator